MNRQSFDDVLLPKWKSGAKANGHGGGLRFR
jgi:hypothetical protein